MVAALVPVKTLATAKSRLSACLGAGERRALTLAMLADVLDTLCGCPRIGSVTVVTADPCVVAFARQWPVQFLDEVQPCGLSDAVARAVPYVTSDRVLVMPADLPLIDGAALDRVLDAAIPTPSMIIAPDRHGRGTNAVLTNAAKRVAWSFGPDSFARHVAEARAWGLVVGVLRDPRLGLDIDYPQDLAEFLTWRHMGHTGQFLARRFQIPAEAIPA
ncbi:MAG: 2-phospho-L-lactate guanylyltransferase [Sphingomonadales bacterium]